jgi:hypothetical protein
VLTLCPPARSMRSGSHTRVASCRGSPRLGDRHSDRTADRHVRKGEAEHDQDRKNERDTLSQGWSNLAWFRHRNVLPVLVVLVTDCGTSPACAWATAATTRSAHISRTHRAHKRPGDGAGWAPAIREPVWRA